MFQKNLTKINVIKQGKFVLYQNVKECKSKFIYNKKLDERKYDEVFAHMKIDLPSLICGFLNGVGGRVVIGADQERKIKGIKMSRKDMDIFQIDLDIELRKFHP